MKKYPFIYSILLIALSFMGCDKETVDDNNSETLDTYLEAQFTNQDIPGLAVLIFKGETIKYEKYLGKSDEGNNIDLTANDVFLMASISKMVTGTALLQLYEDGEFDLDDNINDYLSFNVSVPNQNTPITFRMLLTHTSAIEDGPNAELFYSYGEDSPLGLKNYMEEYLVAGGEYYHASQNFYNYTPGTQHNYSNMASALIGVLVEDITNQNFIQYCKENIFQPLNMNQTYWSLDEALQSNSTLVIPYDYDYEVIQHYTFADYPNGALRSTPRDMMKFLAALAQEGTFNNHQLLKSSTVNEMLTLQIPSLEPSMGLHAFILENTTDIWGHNGSEQGVSTEVGFNTSNDLGVIVLTNYQDADVNRILLKAYEYGLEL